MKVTTNTKILVVCHKEGLPELGEPYLPIHAGKALAKEEFGMLGDDTGDNISAKNPLYCELTAMYWAWKNLKGVDKIGLVHYRRYFDFHHQCQGAFRPIKRFKVSAFGSIDLSIPQDITDTLKEGTAIVASKFFLTKPLYRYYGKNFLGDLVAIEEAIKTTRPSYITAYNHVVGSRGCMSPCNMFIMTWRDFDAYCSWLFSLFSEAERYMNTTHHTPRPRAYGYMAEYLLNVYLYVNRFEVIPQDIIYFSDQRSAADRKLLRRVMHRLWAYIAVPLLRKHRHIQ